MSAEAPEVPAEARASYRARVARWLRRALFEHDISQRDAARACGAPAQHCQQWCDPEATRYLGADVSDRLAADDEPSHLEQLRRVLESAGSVGSTYAGALYDGHLTAREREQLAALAREAVSVLLGVVHVMAPTPPTPIREVR